jgi:hypothetical protein
LRAWRRARTAEIDRAEAALAAYYVKYFGVAPEAARRDARSAIDKLIGDAFASADE